MVALFGLDLLRATAEQNESATAANRTNEHAAISHDQRALESWRFRLRWRFASTTKFESIKIDAIVGLSHFQESPFVSGAGPSAGVLPVAYPSPIHFPSLPWPDPPESAQLDIAGQMEASLGLAPGCPWILLQAPGWWAFGSAALQPYADGEARGIAALSLVNEALPNWIALPD